MPSLRVKGADQLRVLSADIRVHASAKVLRRKLLRDLRAAAEPMKRGVQQNALALPASGVRHTGLRGSIAKATRVKIRSVGKNAVVRVWVNPALMPAGQKTLPAYMEGDGAKWRHPLPNDRAVWVDQASHLYFRPAVAAHLPAVQTAAVAAIAEVAAEIERG